MLGLISARLPALLLPLALAACEGKDGLLTEHFPASSSGADATSGDTTDDPTTGATTDEPTSDDSSSESETTAAPPSLCPCIVDDPDGSVAPSLPTCVDLICPRVDGSYDGYCEGMCIEGAEIDAAALECALVALRDRTPGLIRWSLGIKGELYAGDGYLWIRDDGSAVWRMWEGKDLDYTVTAAQIVELPASATYEQCLASDDESLRFECLRQSLAGPDNFVCDDGWTDEAI